MKKEITFDNLPNAVTELAEKLVNIEKLLLEISGNQSTDQPEKILTVQEAARFLKLSIPTIYSKVSRGELPVMKRSKRLYFSSVQLLEYIKEGRKKSITEIEADAEVYLKSSTKRQSHRG